MSRWTMVLVLAILSLATVAEAVGQVSVDYSAGWEMASTPTYLTQGLAVSDLGLTVPGGNVFFQDFSGAGYYHQAAMIPQNPSDGTRVDNVFWLPSYGGQINWPGTVRRDAVVLFDDEADSVSLPKGKWVMVAFPGLAAKLSQCLYVLPPPNDPGFQLFIFGWNNTAGGYYPMTGDNYTVPGKGCWVYATGSCVIMFAPRPESLGKADGNSGYKLAGELNAIGYDPTMTPPAPPKLESVWILWFKQDSSVATVYPTNTVGLTWKTGWEAENDSFTPYHRVNGGPWEKVLPGNGKVFGLGSSQSGKVYYCQDGGLLGLSGQVDYMLVALGYDGAVDTCKYSFSVHLGPTTEVEVTDTDQPIGYALEQNYPNPFNPSTTVEFQLPKEEKVIFSICNSLGRAIQQYEFTGVAGRNVITWDGRDDYGQQVAAGVYLYNIQAGSFTATRRMSFVK